MTGSKREGTEVVYQVTRDDATLEAPSIQLARQQRQGSSEVHFTLVPPVPSPIVLKLHPNHSQNRREIFRDHRGLAHTGHLRGEAMKCCRYASPIRLLRNELRGRATKSSHNAQQRRRRYISNRARLLLDRPSVLISHLLAESLLECSKPPSTSSRNADYLLSQCAAIDQLKVRIRGTQNVQNVHCYSHERRRVGYWTREDDVNVRTAEIMIGLDWLELRSRSAD